MTKLTVVMQWADRNFADERAFMVSSQLRNRGIRDGRVLETMGSIPRELFVLGEYADEAYADSALPIEKGQTISQPYMVARTCELAALRGDERVMEVGAGSGYQAAVLSKLAKSVLTIERVPELAEHARAALARAEIENVRVVVADGSLGYASAAPFDCIVVAAAAPSVPVSLVEQLALGGRLVVPVGDRQSQRLQVITRTESGPHSESFDLCIFVPLVGREGWASESRGAN